MPKITVASFFSGTWWINLYLSRLQVRPLDRFSHTMAQTTWSQARVCLLGVRKLRINIQPFRIPQSENLGQQDALLSQGELRDATISFDTTASCMRLLSHSMGFLYRPTLATVQMLKLHHTVRRFSQPWRKITAIAEDHGTRPKSQGKPTMIVNTWLFYSAKKCYNA